MTLPWAPGSATGIGSLPGTDIVEALRVVFGELPLPYLPELPSRGPGADLVGRTAGLLVALPVDLYAGQWRVASRPGRDLRRTADRVARHGVDEVRALERVELRGIRRRHRRRTGNVAQQRDLAERVTGDEVALRPLNVVLPTGARRRNAYREQWA